MDWVIIGEAGHALDAQPRAIAALKCDSATLTLASLASDSLDWSARTTDMQGGGTLVPDHGQVIELWGNGVRFFRGHVTAVRVQAYRLSIKVEGPWWWMTKIPLSSPQLDSEGGESVRASYVFPTQDLKTTLETLIDRMIANGVPLIRGVVDPMFVYPRITLSERSCGQALADLLMIVPDAVAWFDYTTQALPVLNISRRANMPAVNLQWGRDFNELDISPRTEQQVASVDIHGVVRNSVTGKPQWVTQSSGTPVPGKNQIVVVSGPEAAHFLPKDRFDQVDVQTAAMPYGTLLSDVQVTSSPSYWGIDNGAVNDFILETSPMVRTLEQKYPIALSVSYGGRAVLGYRANHTGRPEVLSQSSMTGKHLVVSPGKLPDWLSTDNGITIIDGTLRFFLMYFYSGPQYTTTEPDYWYDLVQSAKWAAQGSFTSIFNTAYYGYMGVWEESIPVKLISTQYTSLTTIYRLWDYDYVTPPPGLAAALVTAQNWIPWEGSIDKTEPDPAPHWMLGSKINIDGILPECATMGALVKSVSHDLARKLTQINLGSPARTDFGTLSDRFRGRPKDNIQIL